MATRTDEGILIHEDHENPLYGTVLWESGTSLAKFFAWRATTAEFPLHDQSVIELGAGTGIVGLTLGKLGAKVVMTDCEQALLDLLQRNIDANSLGGNVRVCRADWAEPKTDLTDLNPLSFQLLVAADVVYTETGKIFLRALQAHMSHRCVAYMSYQYRSDEASCFFSEAVLQGLRIEQLQDAEGNAVGSATGQSPNVFDCSSFVVLDETRILKAVSSASFGKFNLHGVQIFRITWAHIPLEEFDVRRKEAKALSRL